MNQPDLRTEQQEREHMLTNGTAEIDRKAIAASLRAAKANKYNAERTKVDGIWFASKKEAKRYGELKLREKVGEIKDLQLQKKFPLSVNGTRLGHYICDFYYRDATSGDWIVEDAKGKRTRDYLWKKKHFEAQYDLKIIEV